MFFYSQAELVLEAVKPYRIPRKHCHVKRMLIMECAYISFLYIYLYIYTEKPMRMYSRSAVKLNYSSQFDDDDSAADT